MPSSIIVPTTLQSMELNSTNGTRTPRQSTINADSNHRLAAKNAVGNFTTPRASISTNSLSNHRQNSFTKLNNGESSLNSSFNTVRNDMTPPTTTKRTSSASVTQQNSSASKFSQPNASVASRSSNSSSLILSKKPSNSDVHSVVSSTKRPGKPRSIISLPDDDGTGSNVLIRRPNSRRMSVISSRSLPRVKTPEIELRDFTKDELEHLEDVVRRADEQRIYENERLVHLNRFLNSVFEKKKHLPLEEKDKLCTYCGAKLRFLINPGEVCKKCNEKMCKKCIRFFKQGQMKLCEPCYYDCMHICQAGKWFTVISKKGLWKKAAPTDLLNRSIEKQKAQILFAEQLVKLEQLRDQQKLQKQQQMAAALAAANTEKPGFGDKIALSLNIGHLSSSFTSLKRSSSQPEDQSKKRFFVSDDSFKRKYLNSEQEEQAVLSNIEEDPKGNTFSVSSTHAKDHPDGQNNGSSLKPTRSFRVSTTTKNSFKLGSRTNLTTLDSGSVASFVSCYSVTSESYNTGIDISGEVELQIRYDVKKSRLIIFVIQCKNIACIDKKRKLPDPYVKTYLLPDNTSHSKRKTAFKQNTQNPVYKENLEYDISQESLDTRTLWVTLWHHITVGRNIFLGECMIPLQDFDFKNTEPRAYSFHEKRANVVNPSQLPFVMYKGDLIVALKYNPNITEQTDDSKHHNHVAHQNQGELHVWIKEAKNLIAAKSNGFSDSFCKCRLLPDKSSKTSKKKTSVAKRSLNPTWNKVLHYHNIAQTDLVDKSLEITIWDYNQLSSNDFLGGVRINLGLGVCKGEPVNWMDGKKQECSLWQSMINQPGKWAEASLLLRPNMD